MYSLRRVSASTCAASSTCAVVPVDAICQMAAVWAPFEEEGEADDGSDLKKVIGQTMGAIWQIASTGTAAQVEEAAQVLAETRRKLYTILAEGDPE